MQSVSAKKRNSTPLRLALSLIFVLVVTWSGLSLRRLGDTVAVSIDDLQNQNDLRDTVAKFDEHIEPILARKCAGCHTHTIGRPFFYYIPLVNHISKPYTENIIRKAREHFDFSNGIVTDRLGATYETILRLRAVVNENSMPPRKYALVRPHHVLSPSEKRAISAWAEKGSEVLLDELTGPQRTAALDQSDKSTDTTAVLASTVAKDIMAACPLAQPDDRKARDDCADSLVSNEILRSNSNNPFLWGGQKSAGDYRPYNNQLTRFDPLLWRKFYLSLFMFEGTYTIDRDGDLLAYVFPVRFRHALGDGEYPYPFWHSRSKWRAYNEAAELILLFSNNKIVGSYRSSLSETLVTGWDERTWNGQWFWNDSDSHALQPRVTNYDTLLSDTNPYVDALSATYLKLSLQFRDENCLVCHSPDNSTRMRALEILSSPAHALSARHRLETVLTANAMPPITGIQSEDNLKKLIARAREFKEIGDKAIAFEAEGITDRLNRPAFD